ncbi:hypothetical protein PENSPDRAFT_96886 [Peniophora sp. CONT]|nr:hypothetical protein PENSPDRAFT_96886 [Peniophora sp. CONT]
MSASIDDYGSQLDEDNIRDALLKQLEEIALKTGKLGLDNPSLPASRLFALLIGVNEYANPNNNLQGAVGDARRVEKFLRAQKPPVSAERIVFLQDSGAKSGDIIASIGSLCTNRYIRHGDPILIYYAGHGSVLPKPKGWSAAGPSIQCLSPHDARIEDETVVGVIPDRTFGALLERLANAKGNNITVILDCCHSGSGSRDDTLQSIPRGMEFKGKDDTQLTISGTYQKEIWVSFERGLVGLPQFANTGLRSHVVLAACSSDESAYEDRFTREGRFTSAFLRVLEVSGTDTMTYSELIRRLDALPSQTPQCEGRDKETRILFDSGLVQRNRPYYGVEKSGDSYKLLAGQINGVNPKDTFALFPDHHAYTSGAASLGSFTVDKVEAMSSTLSLDGTSDLNILASTPHAVAVLTRVGPHSAFLVHVDIEKYPALRVVAEALAKEAANPTEAFERSIVLSPASTATISLVPDTDDSVAFVILDERIRGLGLTRLSGSVPYDARSLRAVLRSAAHFFHHLGSSPARKGLSKAVEERVWEMSQSVDFEAIIPMPVLTRVGQPIDVKSKGAFYPDIPQRGDVNPDRTMYGIDVKSKYLEKQGFDLFVWLFYFDCSTLEICKFYEPVLTADNSEPPLRAGAQEALPLNFGDAGAMPLTFELPPGQDIDVGFLRIFISTQYADLSGMSQKAAVMPGVPKALSMSQTFRSVPQIWDAITVAVVQKLSP